MIPPSVFIPETTETDVVRLHESALSLSIFTPDSFKGDEGIFAGSPQLVNMTSMKPEEIDNVSKKSWEGTLNEIRATYVLCTGMV